MAEAEILISVRLAAASAVVEDIDHVMTLLVQKWAVRVGMTKVLVKIQ
jgi:hypothetical protein